MVFLVPGERKGPGRASKQLRGGQAWNKKRDGERILFERCPVAQMEFSRFPPHHDGIKNREVNNEHYCRDPRARGNSGPKGQYSAAKIERISGVRVGAGD